jgi:hydrogenase nickel incorporation protein HypA/HybF
MHEYSIIQSMIATCKRVIKEHDAGKITKIYVTAGKMSGIDPHFLEQSYEFFREDTVCENAEMIIEVEEVEAVCNDCQQLFQVDKFNFTCPACGGNSVEVVKGKTLQITHIEVDDPGK